jgi:hypothetical protein
MNEQQLITTPKVEAKGIDDLQRIDCLLELAEVPLSEAVKVLSYPEVYGLYDAKSRARSLKKLRAGVERVADCVRRARDLSEMAWCYDGNEPAINQEKRV